MPSSSPVEKTFSWILNRYCNADHLTRPRRLRTGIGKVNLDFSVEFKQIRKSAGMVPVGVGNENLGNGARVEVELLQIMEKYGAAGPGVEENPPTVFYFYKAGETPVSFEAFFKGFVIIDNGDLHIYEQSLFKVFYYRFFSISLMRRWISVTLVGYFPQQLPGPAQPAWLGLDPQQEVSPGAGARFLEGPDMDEWAERSFLRLRLPQFRH